LRRRREAERKLRAEPAQVLQLVRALIVEHVAELAILTELTILALAAALPAASHLAHAHLLTAAAAESILAAHALTLCRGCRTDEPLHVVRAAADERLLLRAIRQHRIRAAEIRQRIALTAKAAAGPAALARSASERRLLPVRDAAPLCVAERAARAARSARLADRVWKLGRGRLSGKPQGDQTRAA
jgi:hypothetical protein